MIQSSHPRGEAARRGTMARHLGLILLPTEKCNFRCTYCYETFEHGRMRPEVVQGVKNLLRVRVPELETLHLSWFGGEPLMESDLMLEISTFAQDLCAAGGCQFQWGEITTNAYLLTEELLGRLVRANQRRFQITLDGYEESHDATRRHIAGKPTFGRIMNALRTIKASDHEVRVLLRLHLTPDNREGMLRLAAELRSDLLTDARFRAGIKVAGDWGGPNTGKIAVVPKAERQARLAELTQALGLCEARDTASLSSGHAVKGEVCYASKPTSLVIRPTGRVAKCTVAFDDPINDVGHLKSDGSIVFNQDRLKFWFTGLSTKDEGHLGCPYNAVPRPAERPAERVIPIAAI
jgi:uncharacterized protein